jgi:hypothetical protein
VDQSHRTAVDSPCSLGLLNVRAELNSRAGCLRRPGRRIGEIVTLAMMPDRCDILGDPGPVRVSPSLGLICRIP